MIVFSAFRSMRSSGVVCCCITGDESDSEKLFRPAFQKTVIGEGMPVSKQSGAHGNIVLHFDICFPSTLTPQQKKTIAHVLS
eukprot:m.16390 g.16390  ORF g.16390 m.16390 type:complete len:82 (+) comp26896_c0_seq1:1303-1548(+)